MDKSHLNGDLDEFLEEEWPLSVDSWSISSHPSPIKPFIIENVLQQGLKMSIGGGSKTYKSWVLLDLALSVAHGVPWLGLNTVAGKVMFVNLEIDTANFEQRLMKVAEAKGLTLRPDNLRIWNLRGYACPYKLFIKKLIDALKEDGFSLIIIDPIYKILGDLDENTAGDITKLMNAFERMCRDTKASSAFSAHFSKGNQAEKSHMDRVSGSGVFGRDPDSVMTLTKHVNPDSFTVEMTLRDHAPQKPFVVRWEFPLMHRDDIADPKLILKKVGAERRYTHADVLRLLPTTGLTRKEWLAACQAVLFGDDDKPISTATFDRIKKKLIAGNAVVEEGNTCFPFQITLE